MCVCLLCAVHICDVPLQDILRAGGLLADKSPATVDSKHDKPDDDVLKENDRTAVGKADVADQVDKTFDKPKKTARLSVPRIDDDDDDANSASRVVKKSEKTKKIPRLSLDHHVTDADEKLKQQNISVDDQVKRRRRRSSNVQADGLASDKILPLPAEGRAATTLKEVVSEKEPRRRQSRQSTKVTASLSTLQPANEHLSLDSRTTMTRGDVSYGSEAMEDVIQRLLDNDELMDDADQLSIASYSAPSSVPAQESTSMISPDRRSRDITKPKPGKSPRSQISSVKSPASTVQSSLKSPEFTAPTTVGKSSEIPTKKPGRSLRSDTPLAKLPGLVKSPGNSVAATLVAGADATGWPANTHSDTEESPSVSTTVSSGPRIKHVCRYASIALGKPLATFPTATSSQLQLSALPSQEKERFLVDKRPGMYIVQCTCRVRIHA